MPTPKTKSPKKKKPDFLIPPVQNCSRCSGSGEILSHFTLFGGRVNKTCPRCGGSGVRKETYYCIKCNEKLHGEYAEDFCVNENCENCGLVVMIYVEKE